MIALVGVVSPRAGSTATYFATCLSYTLADDRRVVLVDADMSGGTVADLLHLKTEGRSLAHLYGGDVRAIEVAELEAMAVPVPHRPNLRVVPGIESTYGNRTSWMLPPLDAALKALSADVVVCDLGQALCYPGIESPSAEAEAICKVFQRVFVVTRDDPALFARYIEVLRQARLPRAELVITQSRHRRLGESMAETMSRQVGDVPIRYVWPWDERRAAHMGDSGVPMTLRNVHQLGI
jgi:MinD-like ATPase involved in chromosome partitioning or flagellar assembly